MLYWLTEVSIETKRRLAQDAPKTFFSKTIAANSIGRKIIKHFISII